MLIKSLHIEPTNICTLKCAGCARTQFIRQWPNHWKNHSIDTDSLLKFLDIDLSQVRINLCGNYGDPIYHPDFLNLVQSLKSRRAPISITTNGSYRTAEWWENLTKEMDKQDSVIFSIDGLPNTFTQYRANADWPSIQEAIKICVAAGVRTVWKFIPFCFNQQDISTAQELSKDLGISQFTVVPSDRFDQDTDHLRPDPDLLGERWFAQQAIKTQATAINDVAPKCHKGHEHFISAEGYYCPCCYIADHRFYHKMFWGKDKRSYDIQHTTLTQLLARDQVMKFYQNIDKNPPLVCQYNCPG